MRRSSAIRISTKCGSQQLDQDFVDRLQRREGPLVTILPGSRTQEVTQNLEWFLRAAAIVKARVPDVRFAVAAFKPQHAQFARERFANRAGRSSFRAEDAGVDSSGGMLHGRFRLGIAGAALSEEADGDSLSCRSAGLLDAGPLPPREIHHARESAFGEGYFPRAGGQARSGRATRPKRRSRSSERPIGCCSPSI